MLRILGKNQISLADALWLSLISALFVGALLANVFSATGAETIGLAISGAIVGAISGAIGGAIFGASAIVIGSQPLYLPTMLFNLEGWMGVAAFCLALVLGHGALWWNGARRQRQAQNPLQGLLKTSMAAVTVEPRVDLRWIGFIPGIVERLVRRQVV